MGTAPPALPKLSSSEEQGATWLPSMLESSGGTRQTWPHEPCWSEPKLLREAFYKHQSLLKHFPSAQPLCPKFLWFFLVCSTSLKAPFDVHSCFSILELVCQKIHKKGFFTPNKLCSDDLKLNNAQTLWLRQCRAPCPPLGAVSFIPQRGH